MACHLERNISREVVLFIYVQIGQGVEVWVSIEQRFGCIQHSQKITKTSLRFRIFQCSSKGGIKEEENSLGKDEMIMKTSQKVRGQARQIRLRQEHCSEQVEKKQLVVRTLHKGDTFAPLESFANPYLSHQHLVHGSVFYGQVGWKRPYPSHSHWITAGIHYDIIPTQGILVKRKLPTNTGTEQCFREPNSLSDSK